jgi:hypothetical protein
VAVAEKAAPPVEEDRMPTIEAPAGEMAARKASGKARTACEVCARKPGAAEVAHTHATHPHAAHSTHVPPAKATHMAHAASADAAAHMAATDATATEATASVATAATDQRESAWRCRR